MAAVLIVWTMLRKIRCSLFPMTKDHLSPLARKFLPCHSGIARETRAPKKLPRQEREITKHYEEQQFNNSAMQQSITRNQQLPSGFQKNVKQST
jgi:hypothetical protein